MSLIFAIIIIVIIEVRHTLIFFFFFFNDTATTEIYTLSLHDALPISSRCGRAKRRSSPRRHEATVPAARKNRRSRDRKSTRLNSSHGYISYAVFCLKKKNKKKNHAERITQKSDTTP